MKSPIEKWGVATPPTKEEVKIIKKMLTKKIYENSGIGIQDSKKHIAYGRAVALYNEFKQARPHR